MAEAPESWEEAVAEASEHVGERSIATTEAARRQKPRSRAPRIAAATVLLLALVAWDIKLMATPPESNTSAEERVHLAWFVRDVVEALEDFETEEGRFPDLAEFEALFEEDVAYRPSPDQYTVTAEGDSVRLEYESTVPLSEWMSSTVGPDPEGGP